MFTRGEGGVCDVPMIICRSVPGLNEQRMAAMTQNSKERERRVEGRGEEVGEAGEEEEEGVCSAGQLLSD